MDTPLATLLISARRRLGLTQSELAKRMGLSQPRIVTIEKGEGAVPAKRADAIAQAINVPVEVVRESIKATQIALKGGALKPSPYAFTVEFTPLEHRRVLQYVAARDWKRAEEWIRKVVLDALSNSRQEPRS